jgi:hypothetical protein
MISKQDTDYNDDDYDINVNTGKFLTAADTSSNILHSNGQLDSNVNKNNDKVLIDNVIGDENDANDDDNDIKDNNIEHIVESRGINNITTTTSNLSKNQLKKIKKLELRKQIKLFKKEAKKKEKKHNDTAATPITTSNDFTTTSTTTTFATIINDCRMDSSHVIDIKNGSINDIILTTTTSIDGTRSVGVTRNVGVMYGDNINNDDVYDDDKKDHRKRPRVERKASTIQSFVQSCSENFSIVIDCSFEDKHSEASLKSLSQQIIYCYGMKC